MSLWIFPKQFMGWGFDAATAWVEQERDRQIRELLDQSSAIGIDDEASLKTTRASIRSEPSSEATHDFFRRP